jgi:hypothetical protein
MGCRESRAQLQVEVQHKHQDTTIYFNFNSPHTPSIKPRSGFLASCQRQPHAETPDSDSWGLEQLLG